MPWIKLDDQFADHPKVAAAGPLAGWLHVCAMVYCGRYLTDGFVPAPIVHRLADFRGIQVENSDVDHQVLVQSLIDVGLWEETEGGYHIHDFLAFNRSRAEVLRDREDAERRKEEGRARGYERVSRGERGRFAPKPPQTASTALSGNTPPLNVVENTPLATAIPDPDPDPGSVDTREIVAISNRIHNPGGNSEDAEVISRYVVDFRREFADRAKVAASVGRAVHLYQASGLPLEGFIGQMYAARQATKGSANVRRRMAYWFACLEDSLGLGEQGQGHGARSPPAP